VTVIERDTPLSRSRLWDLQRSWYEHAGPGAWSEGQVPHYITTNPTIGAAIAQVIAGWARDGGAGGEPITIVELGAGTGRLGWHVARRLRAMPHVVPRFRYLLTDVAERTLAWWRAHPQLARVPELGVARLDVEADDEPPDEIAAGPLVVVGTYLVDSVRADAFAVRGGALHERRLTLLEAPGADPTARLAPGDVRCEWSLARVDGARYGDPDLDAVLAAYPDAVGGADAELTFPIAVLRCLRRLERRAGGRMLVIAADKGFVDPAQMIGRGEPIITLHGSISIDANLHALAACARRRGAATFATPPSGLRLAAVALAHGAPRSDELALAFDDAFGRAGPEDWFALKRALERRYTDCTLDELLAILRTSRGDENVLRGCASTLIERIRGADPAELPAVRDTIAAVMDGYFWIGERVDVPFVAGVALYLAGDPAAARAAWSLAQELGAHADAPAHEGWFALRLGPRDDPRVAALAAEPQYAALRTRLFG
jgi:hypothetical protein